MRGIRQKLKLIYWGTDTNINFYNNYKPKSDEIIHGSNI